MAVTGEIDLLTAPRLGAELHDILRTSRRHIAVDLTKTAFMDSAGVHVLVNARQRARDLAVICGPGPILRTLELLGLLQLLQVVPTPQEYKLRRSCTKTDIPSFGASP